MEKTKDTQSNRGIPLDAKARKIQKATIAVGIAIILVILGLAIL